MNEWVPMESSWRAQWLGDVSAPQFEEFIGVWKHWVCSGGLREGSRGLVVSEASTEEHVTGDPSGATGEARDACISAPSSGVSSSAGAGPCPLCGPCDGVMRTAPRAFRSPGSLRHHWDPPFLPHVSRSWVSAGVSTWARAGLARELTLSLKWQLSRTRTSL